MLRIMAKSPSERLKEARERRFETAQDAAEAHGWNPTTYRSHENGIRNYPLATARKYARAFGTTPAELLGLRNSVNSEILNAVANVPLIAKVSAGAWRVDEGLDTEGALVPAVPHSSVPADAQYAVAVDGPSVNRKIADGAFAICARYDRYPGGPQHGQLVHVIRHRADMREHTIKELRYTRDGMILSPCSDDPRYQETLALASGEEDTTVTIEGVVIGVYQPL